MFICKIFVEEFLEIYSHNLFSLPIFAREVSKYTIVSGYPVMQIIIRAKSLA